MGKFRGEKFEADKPFYKKDLKSWEMVSREEVGKSFVVIFDVKKPNEKSRDCLNRMMAGLRDKKPIEFGFGETAIKRNKEGKYVSTGLTWFHKSKAGTICVHGG